MSEDDQALYKKGLNTPEAENQNPDYTMTKRITPPSNVSFDGQSSFFPGFVKYCSIVAKDCYLFTCCFHTYHVIKKDISFFFSFIFLSLK